MLLIIDLNNELLILQNSKIFNYILFLSEYQKIIMARAIKVNNKNIKVTSNYI